MSTAHLEYLAAVLSTSFINILRLQHHTFYIPPFNKSLFLVSPLWLTAKQVQLRS
ncbi:hypothetical protein [Paraglaciecola sp. L1A13]|uniref:hypothetical protein n=1 Tax=Paraglaciecola sp. L1A13 TaxID=2686359 RepID=UPI00131D2341|nr:hypothetical protein [Paraglaciecola sp. L1A13]